MMQRSTRRMFGIGMASAGVVVTALAFQASRSIAQPGKPLERGNAYGEWRYWGADAWSSRYSPLEQINASNFDSLKVAWTWNAGTFGKDEYYRTTPLLPKAGSGFPVFASSETR